MTDAHEFGGPLKPVLQRAVRRDDAGRQTFFHVTIEVAGNEFGLDFVLSDGAHEIELSHRAETACIQIGSLLRPWLDDMIKKNVR